MSIQQLGCAACALLVQSPLGFAAAKACTIGLGLFGRLIPRDALLETFEIDQIPHDRPRHSCNRSCGATANPHKLSRGVLVNSVAIGENPRRKSFKKHIPLWESGLFLCSTTTQCKHGRSST